MTERSFRLLLATRVLWTLAIQMLLVAMGWQAYELTHQAWTLALIGLCQFLPVLLFSVPAGWIVDRFSHRRLITLCLALQFATAAGLAALSWQGPPDHRWLYAASVLLGLARSTLMPALQALLPAVVAEQRLARATAAVSTATQASVIIGPALAGFLVVWGVAQAHAVAAGLMALALLLPLLMAAPEQAPAARKLSVEALFAGFRFIGGQPVVLGAILLDLFAVLFGGAVALLPVFVKDVLGGSASDLGLLRAAPAVGAVLMSLRLVARPMARQVGRKLLLTVAVFGLATVVFGLSRHFWLSAAALAISGAADMVSVVIRQTLVQLETPPQMRGRVSAVNSVFIGASNQLGEFQAGLAATLLTPVVAVVAGGLVTALLPLLWLQLFPGLARRDAMTPAQAARTS